MAKKLLSLALALTMLVSVVTVGIFASSATASAEATGTTVVSGTTGWTKSATVSAASLMGTTEGKYNPEMAGINYFGAVGNSTTSTATYTHTAVDLGQSFELTYRHMWQYLGNDGDGHTNHLDFTIGDLVIKAGREGVTNDNWRSLTVSYKGNEVIYTGAAAVNTTVDYDWAAEVDIACNNSTQVDEATGVLYNNGTYWDGGNGGGTNTRSSLSKVVDITVKFDRGVLSVYTGLGDAKTLYGKCVLENYDFSNVAPKFVFAHSAWLRAVVTDVTIVKYDDVVGEFSTLTDVAFGSFAPDEMTASGGWGDVAKNRGFISTDIEGVGDLYYVIKTSDYYSDPGHVFTSNDTFNLGDQFNYQYTIHFGWNSGNALAIDVSVGDITVTYKRNGSSVHALDTTVYYKGTQVGTTKLMTGTDHQPANADVQAAVTADVTSKGGSPTTGGGFPYTPVTAVEFDNGNLKVVAGGETLCNEAITGYDFTAATISGKVYANPDKTTDLSWNDQVAISGWSGTAKQTKTQTDSFGDLSAMTTTSPVTDTIPHGIVENATQTWGDLIYQFRDTFNDTGVTYKAPAAFNLYDKFDYSFTYLYGYSTSGTTTVKLGDLALEIAGNASDWASVLTVKYKGETLGTVTEVSGLNHTEHQNALDAALADISTTNPNVASNFGGNFQAQFNVSVSFDNGKLVVMLLNDTYTASKGTVEATLTDYDFTEAELSVKFVQTGAYKAHGFTNWSGSFTYPVTCEIENANNLSYSEWVADAYNVNNTDANAKYYEHRICHNCGEKQSRPVMTPNGQNLTVQDSIGINFYAVEDFTEYYEDAQITYLDRYGASKVATPVAYTANGVNYQRFVAEDIAPSMMGDAISYTIQGKYNGELVSKTFSYAATTYCTAILADENQDADLRNLVAEMLRYGADAQVYTAHKTDALVSKILEDNGWTELGVEAVDPANDQALTSGTVAEEKLTWYGAALNLKDKISVQLAFKANVDFSADTTLKVTLGGETYTCEADNFQYYAKGDYYYVYFNELNPAQLRTTFTAQLFEGDTAVSEQLTYSAQTYAYQVKANYATRYQALYNLTQSMMKYGDAAAAYNA